MKIRVYSREKGPEHITKIKVENSQDDLIKYLYQKRITENSKVTR